MSNDQKKILCFLDHNDSVIVSYYGNENKNNNFRNFGFSLHSVQGGGTWRDYLFNLHNRFPDKGILLINSDITTILNDSTINKLITKISNTTHEIIYLCTWGDHCQMRHFESQICKDFSMYSTQHPRGMQAVFFPTKHRENLIKKIIEIGDVDDLSHMIYGGKINAGIISPAPFILNPYNIKDNTDYQKVNPCKNLTVAVRDLPEMRIPNESTPFIIYAVIAIVLGLLLIVVIKTEKQSI